MFAQIGVAAGFAGTTIKTLDVLLSIDMLIQVVIWWTQPRCRQARYGSPGKSSRLSRHSV